jgi:hypothetical protein
MLVLGAGILAVSLMPCMGQEEPKPDPAGIASAECNQSAVSPRSPFRIRIASSMGHFEFFAACHRRNATSDQIASTNPKGHAPCKNP